MSVAFNTKTNQTCPLRLVIAEEMREGVRGFITQHLECGHQGVRYVQPWGKPVKRARCTKCRAELVSKRPECAQ